MCFAQVGTDTENDFGNIRHQAFNPILEKIMSDEKSLIPIKFLFLSNTFASMSISLKKDTKKPWTRTRT
jgi:hypothetical protein